MPYQDVKDRLYHGHRKVANNTYLGIEIANYGNDREYVVMRLHGNVVAVFYPTYLELFSARWHTTTTKNRLNLALNLAGIPGTVYQNHWEWFYSNDRYADGKVSIVFTEGMKLNY